MTKSGLGEPPAEVLRPTTWAVVIFAAIVGVPAALGLYAAVVVGTSVQEMQLAFVIPVVALVLWAAWLCSQRIEIGDRELRVMRWGNVRHRIRLEEVEAVSTKGALVVRMRGGEEIGVPTQIYRASARRRICRFFQDVQGPEVLDS